MSWYFFKIIFDNFYYIMLNKYIYYKGNHLVINKSFFFGVDEKIWSTGI